VIEFAGCGWQGQNCTKWNSLFQFLCQALGEDIPGFDVFIRTCQRNKLRAVDHRTAACCQQEIDIFFAHLLDGFHQCGIIGIGFNAAEFDDFMFLECIDDLIVNAIFFD